MRTRTSFPQLAVATLAFSLLMLPAGCKKQAPTTAAQPAQNSQPATPQNAPEPQGTLNSDGTYTQPATETAAGTQQAPASGTSAATAPQQQQAGNPPPPPPAPVAYTLPHGTRIPVRITERLSASHNEVGDAFSGVLAEPVVLRGTVVLPRGTRVAGTVIASKGRGRFKGAGALGIELTTIGALRVHTTEYEQEAKGKGKRTAGLIGGGGGLGAILGGIAGGGRGAVIGGIAGAGAGTAGAAFTGNRDVVIPSESRVTFRLTEPVTVQ